MIRSCIRDIHFFVHILETIPGLLVVTACEDLLGGINFFATTGSASRAPWMKPLKTLLHLPPLEL